MEEFFKPVTAAIEPLLNPESDEPEEVAPTTAGGPSTRGATGKKDDPKKAAPAKAAPAKGAKGQPAAEAALAQYESNLPTTSSGIENVVICVDHRFETLPIESLNVFRKSPVVSRDLNLHLHMNRLQTLGHKADLHNNRGINKDELRYIIDIPNSPELVEEGTNYVKDEMHKMMPGSNWDGILTR